MADPVMQDTQKSMDGDVKMDKVSGEDIVVENLVIPRKRPRSGTTDTSKSPGTDVVHSDGFGDDNIVLPVPGGEGTTPIHASDVAGRSVSLGLSPSPTKSRSPYSSLHRRAKRTPSLNDSPIPILQPEESNMANSGGVSATPIGKSVRLGSGGSSSLKVRRSSGGGFISPLASRSISSPSKLLSVGSNNSETAQLLRQDRELTMEINALQKQINTSKQALKIEEKDQDIQLEELTEKWRHGAQEAANYLFGQAAERINRYGGYAEYKLRQAERKKTWQNWESPSDLPEGSEMMAQEAHKHEAQIKKIEEKDDDDDDDTEFTIKKMLKELNVDPNIIFPQE